MTERALLVRSTCTTNGRFVAFGIESVSARVFDTATGTLVAEISSSQRGGAATLTAVCLTESPGRSLPLVALGTSTGRLLCGDCATGELTAETLVGDGSTAVTAIAEEDSTFYAINAAGQLAVVRPATGSVVCTKLKTGLPRACSLDVAAGDKGAVTILLTTPAGCGVFRDVPHAALTDGAKLERTVSFSGHASIPDRCKLLPGSEACVTASSADGVLRLWDLRESSGSDAQARCRVSMPSGQRLTGLTVFATSTTKMSDLGRDVVVAVTAVSGEVFAWRSNLLKQAATSVSSLAPLHPGARLRSDDAAGRLLFASLLPPTAMDGTTAAAAGPACLVVRGRWATPAFDKLSPEVIQEAFYDVTQVRHAAAAKAKTTILPFMDDAAVKNPSAHIVINKKKVSRKPLLAATNTVVASTTHTGRVPVTLAASVDELPVAVQPLTKDSVDESQLGELLKDERATVTAAIRSGGGTGGVVVLLHQALHARDASLVVELAMLASRSAADLIATVHQLRVEYLVELLCIMGDRIATASISSPLHGWVFTILRERGSELRELLQEEGDAKKKDLAATVRAVLTPILDRYRRVTALSGGVAMCVGRSEVFTQTKLATKTTVAFRHTYNEPRAVGAMRAVELQALGGDAGSDVDDEDVAAVANVEGLTTKKRVSSLVAKGVAKRKATREALVADRGSDDDDAAVADGGARPTIPELEDADGEEPAVGSDADDFEVEESDFDEDDDLGLEDSDADTAGSYDTDDDDGPATREEGDEDSEQGSEGRSEGEDDRREPAEEDDDDDEEYEEDGDVFDHDPFAAELEGAERQAHRDHGALQVDDDDDDDANAV